MAEPDINTEKWKLNSSGYYYYEDIVEASGQTEPLFENIVLSTDAGNDYMNQNLNIQIDAEAIQSRNNDRTNPFAAD